MTPRLPSDSQDAGVRLQKVLSQAGVASRRAGEDLITAGRVSVNGRVVTTLGTRVDPVRDAIEVDGERIEVRDETIVLAMNKPPGLVTTAKDELGRRTVMELVPDPRGIFPIGRLDKDTTGLLLLSNHGELGNRLAHPRRQIERVYLAEVHGIPDRETLKLLQKGVMLEDGIARVTKAQVVDHQPGRSHVELTLTEGRNREVRRMMESVGHPVRHLGRISFGPIRLGDLPVGKTRYLSRTEIGSLLRLVEL